MPRSRLNSRCRFPLWIPALGTAAAWIWARSSSPADVSFGGNFRNWPTVLGVSAIRECRSKEPELQLILTRVGYRRRRRRALPPQFRRGAARFLDRGARSPLYLRFRIPAISAPRTRILSRSSIHRAWPDNSPWRRLTNSNRSNLSDTVSFSPPGTLI